MSHFITYMIKASLYLAAFYMVYALFLSKDTLYGRNRTFVLLSVITSLILPFITIRTGDSFDFPVFRKVLSDIFIYGTSSKQASVFSADSLNQWIQVIFTIYMSGVIILGLKLILDLTELIFLIIRNKSRSSHIIRFRGLSTAGFSAFGHIFINDKLTPEEAREIIKHEQFHLDRHHSLDIVFLEFVKVFQWFNPVIYMFRRSIRAVHEYQVDACYLDTGAPADNYQRLLLNQVFKSKVFTVTNSFSNPTLIKKRMIMMTKKRSKAPANLKLLIVLPVIALVMMLISSCSQKNDPAGNVVEASPPPPPPPPANGIDSTEPFAEVDEMPIFAGGDAAIIQYLMENTKYPENAKTNGIQGKVIVRFAVEPDGNVDKISILKGVDPELDKEALRVVSTFPAFEKPGKKDGKAVAVWYMVPINFTLK